MQSFVPVVFPLPKSQRLRVSAAPRELLLQR